MTLFETVGNIKVYTKHHTDNNSIEVSFLNGCDFVARETYFNTTIENAIADLFAKLDIYTEEWLWLNCLPDGLEKLTDNTYKAGSMDWFCRIDETRYFKHFHKDESVFILDKYGERIIDR